MNFQEIHSYYRTLAIADSFTDTATEDEEIILAANKRWRPESGYIYFCIEDSLSILMPDGGLSIGNSIEYMPIGLMERYYPLAKFEHTGSGPVTLRKIAYTAFDRLFIENHPQRVKASVKMLVLISILTVNLHNERRQVVSYQTIRPMLYRYLYRQHTHEGENEGLVLFIIRRTNLLRTHVFRVLADLKAGGYITTKRSKFIPIDRPLLAGYRTTLRRVTRRDRRPVTQDGRQQIITASRC